MRFVHHGKSDRFDRDFLDITFENAWLGYGYYWDFADQKESAGAVQSDDIFSTGDFGWITGDEVAHRISVWSNSKPRYIINGQPRDWVKPARLDSS